MRILIVGAGGVGSSAALIAARRDFFEQVVIADYDVDRARTLGGRIADPRFSAAQVDASDAQAVAAGCAATHADHPRAQRGRPAVRDDASSTAPSWPARTTSTPR